MGWLMAGYMASAHGGTDEAEDAFDRAAGRFRAVGDRWGLSQALTGLSSVAEARGELDRQTQALREALQQVELLGAREDQSRLLITLGSLEAMRGDREQGLAQVDEGMRVARELGSADALASGHFWKGSLARRLGNLTEARHQFERGLAIFGDENRMHPVRAMALVGLGFVAEQAGDLPVARARHLEAAGQILALPFMPIWTPAMLANVVDGLAGVALAGGDAEEAALLVGAASGMRTIELRGDARWDVDRIIETARRALGEERFTQTHERGAAMTYEEILARITT
jgi:tetratricopeptide (TPR) repeat protein